VFGNLDETLALVFEKTLSTYFIPLSQWKITHSEPAPATDDQVCIQLLLMLIQITPLLAQQQQQQQFALFS